MKLLVCTQAVDKNHPILGGFHVWFLEFAKAFDEVHIICLIKGEHDLPDNVHVYSLGKENGENRFKYVLRFYTYFWHVFFTVKVDYVLFHQGAIYNILAAPFFFVRKIHKTHFYWWKAHGLINLMNRFASIFVDTIYTSTASGYPIDTPKRKIIGQAIDTEFFVPPVQRSNELNMIFTGRIKSIKKIELFLETYVALRERGYQLSISIAGPIDDQRYYESLLAYCDRNNIDRSVFLGPKTQSELVALYQKGTVFLNTSVTHSMDKTVLEAMLCGCIPVTGNKAFAEILGLEKLYIENATTQEYVERVAQVLDGNPQELRTALRERVIAAHSVSTLVHRMFGI